MENHGLEVTDGSGLRDRFPGYYPPDDQQRKAIFAGGLVSLDASSLLSLYRFSPVARNELLDILAAIKERVFVTHQAALEFHRNRLEVVDDRLDAAAKEAEAISKVLEQVREKIRAFSKRYQNGNSFRDDLCSKVDELDSQLRIALTDSDPYDLDRDEVRRSVDPVIARLNDILNGRIGRELDDDDYKIAMAEAERRRLERIPPGFADGAKGDPARRAGDYIVWRQLLDEAKRHNRPVMLVSDDAKEDWVRIGRRNENLGPRPELVLEMDREAGVPFHLVSVLGLLLDAPRYLGSHVSDSTLQEAEILPTRSSTIHSLTPGIKSRLEALGPSERRGFIQAVDDLANWIDAGNHARDYPLVGIPKGGARDHYLLRWSDTGRAVFTYYPATDDDEFTEITWISLSFKRSSTRTKTSSYSDI